MDAASLVDAERRAVDARIASLTRRFDDIVESSRLSTDDDEHDPEGSTIAFERAQVAALLTQARRERDELESARARLASGEYGRCRACGRAIAPARLEALPAATTCIDCS
ncbi:dksa/trar family transcriptional regulator [Rhodococcus rhodnii]|uniref:Dksa/trar family transcriptional regulator n=1 Tax=Rhodococcus rhodnii TaxID=38312 RepID=A0A6P2CIK4_9NOCA|nr:TraR/DksA C4-type zinc finger protein [Rhodococcus rhodnii]TXG92465.1 dksa/trar family transcriptional regulator [Rhodococcus rhodnii]